MNKSESITKLAYALCLAQAEMPAAIMNATNPFLKNKYADLGATIEASRAVLAKFKLAIAQFPASDGADRIGVTTILMHESGEFLEETVLLAVTEERGVNTAQVAGRNITYLRRYSWASVLGMVSEEDTDGVVEAKKELEKERVWAIDAMEAVISVGGIASTHAEAKEVLDCSVLPEDAPIKTVQSWLKHFAGSGKDSMIAAADVANQAYTKAKKGGKQ